MTATLTTLVSFDNTDGREPRGGLIADAAGDLFGPTESGGDDGDGTVFEIKKTADGYASTPTVLASFNGFDGEFPGGSLLADAEGDLFGTTAFGGPAGLGMGTVFELVKTPTGYASTPGTVVNFVNLNGFDPDAGLTADANGNLFGTAQSGGASNDGVVFEITKSGDSSTLVSFNGADGQSPGGNLIVDANGDLFGTTANGGPNSDGTVFEIKRSAKGYASAPTTLVSFDGTDGLSPRAGLIADANGDLFGTTRGTVFEIVKTATGYANTPTTLASFDPVPLSVGGLIMDAKGDLFGITSGTVGSKGTVFEIKKTASGYAPTPTTLVSFNFLDRAGGSLIADSDGNLFGTTASGGDHDDGTVFEITGSGFVPGGAAKPPTPSIGDLVPPNRVTTLVSFNGADSSNPRGDLIADSSGDLFGTTTDGGVGTPANPANGAVFEIKKTAGGYASTPTILVSFNGTNGSSPVSGLIADAEGDLFGTTSGGGPGGLGTVFEIKKTTGYASTPTTLVSFDGANGGPPKAGLTVDADGNLFGTAGTVFEIVKTAGGYASTPTTLAGNRDFGDSAGTPPFAALLADSNGDLFGTTQLGGDDDFGAVFEIKKTATGYASKPTTLASFSGDDGEIPEAGLIADSRGDLFGTTEYGGSTLSLPDGNFALGAGTVFEIVKTAAAYASTPLTLATFHDLSDGLSPLGRLIIDANGDLFGTTSGVSDVSPSSLPATPGTVFELKKTAAGYAGTPITLAAFNGADGATPLAGLIADASGDLFGTTSGGTPDILTHDRGTVFEIADSGFVTTASTQSPADAILFQNASGQAAMWGVDGTKVIAGGTVTPNPGPGWKIIGTGEFNDDGLPDILWQNTSSGQASIWDMDGTSLIGGGAVTPNPGPSWRAVGTGDFNHDGHSDILWQNTGTDEASIWEMSGNSLIGGAAVSPNPGPAWKAIGTGDFNKDGDSDILWQNVNSGQVSIWEMNGGSLIGGGAVTPNPRPSWKAIGTGDFNDDGRSDILFQNKSTGQVSVWDMDGNSLIGGGPVNANPGPDWHAIGTGDFNGDGFSDILLQNISGQTSIWDMNGNTIIGGGTLSANAGPSWHAVGLT